MRLLHVTDLHFEQTHFDWVWRRRHEVDAVCITGDFLEPALPVALSEQIKWVSAWLGSFDTPIFVCTGNHDIEQADLIALSLEELFFGEERPAETPWMSRIVNPMLTRDGQQLEISNVRIGCMPYDSFSFEASSSCDVVLTHVPPASTLVSTELSGSDYGCAILHQALLHSVLKPRHLLTGHVHNPRENKVKVNNTVIWNPGSYSKGMVPKYHILNIV